MPRAAWVAAVALLTAGGFNPAAAQPLAPIAPDGGPPPAPLGSTPVTPTRNPDRPPPVLGSPVSVENIAPRSVTPVGYTTPPAGTQPQQQRGAAFGVPSAASSDGLDPPAPVAPVPAATVDATRTKTASQTPPADPVNDFLFKRSGKSRDGKATTNKSASSTDDPLSSRKFDVGEQLEKTFGTRNGDWFKSDHCLDSFISPVSNPFLFEDPRSLTEVRPIFIYQGVLIGVLGTILGLIAGYGISFAAGHYHLVSLSAEVYSIDYVPFATRAQDGVLVAIVAIGVSFIATLYPSWSAASVLPAEALRYE